MVHNTTSPVFFHSHTEKRLQKHITIALQLNIIDHGAQQKSMQMEITSTDNTKTADQLGCGSCHLDRVLNVEIGVEYRNIFVVVLF